MAILGLLVPPLCLCCRRPLARAPRGPALCRTCDREIDRAASRALAADALDAGFAALPYTGAGARLVARLKFSRALAAADLGAALIEARAPWPLPAVIVPVPAAPLRALARGFDPAAELAAAVGRRSGGEATCLLRRRDLGRQRGRSRRERIARPPAIEAMGAVPDLVLLVDDVVTTGATLDAAARALRDAGARLVVAAALASVHPPRPTLARSRHRGIAWAPSQP